MVSTDPIADMLTRIRNAIAVRKDSVSMPHSNMKEAVARILADNHFVNGVSVSDSGISKQLTISINDEGSNAVITEISRLSTPGRRLYSSADAIPTVKQGRGMVIISTSKGIMSGRDAKTQRLGGELICKVY